MRFGPRSSHALQCARPESSARNRAAVGAEVAKGNLSVYAQSGVKTIGQGSHKAGRRDLGCQNGAAREDDGSAGGDHPLDVDRGARGVAGGARVVARRGGRRRKPRWQCFVLVLGTAQNRYGGKPRPRTRAPGVVIRCHPLIEGSLQGVDVVEGFESRWGVATNRGFMALEHPRDCFLFRTVPSDMPPRDLLRGGKRTSTLRSGLIEDQYHLEDGDAGRN
jgi:hypothetical protein